MSTSNEDSMKDENQKKSLHKSLRFVLVIAQFMGQLPVEGIFEEDPRNLRFTWKSWKILYTTSFTAGVCVVLVIHTCKMFKYGTDIFIISQIVYYIIMLSSAIFFLQLAKSWPNLMRMWFNVEVSMQSYGWPYFLEMRFKIMTIIVFLLTAIQYTLMQVSLVTSTFRCMGLKQHKDFFRHFYSKQYFVLIFQIVEYAAWKGVIFQVIDFLTAFFWSFTDLFIMLMSTALALRFKQVTARLRSAADAKMPTEAVWRSIREDYNKLCKLCRCLDDSISYIVLMSFAGNLFFILIQLFNSLRVMKNNLERIYFFVSFGFLILRTVYVSLYGAWINDESKRPITVLNSVPSAIYNSEIRRFMQQISYDTVALTGRNFFSVTRSIILSIAGAIVTYELVLIQFNEHLLKRDAFNNTEMECG